jgi:hypothetical protein
VAIRRDPYPDQQEAQRLLVQCALAGVTPVALANSQLLQRSGVPYIASRPFPPAEATLNTTVLAQVGNQGFGHQEMRICKGCHDTHSVATQL